jgi:squalene cyclase
MCRRYRMSAARVTISASKGGAGMRAWGKGALALGGMLVLSACTGAEVTTTALPSELPVDVREPTVEDAAWFEAWPDRARSEQREVCDTFADAGYYHSVAVVEFLREECVEILAAKAEVGT